MKEYNIYDNLTVELLRLFNSSKSASITIHGDSGTGKTHLVTRTLLSGFEIENSTIIYINLQDDILTTTAFWDIVLFTTWNEVCDKVTPLKIDKKNSFHSFLQKKINGKNLAKILFKSISNVVMTIPVYSAQISIQGISAENEKNMDNKSEIEKSQIVFDYFRYITKKGKLIIAIDNYQFMNHTIQHFFETSINHINKNVYFINIQRTNQVQVRHPLAFENNYYEQELKSISKENLSQYVLEPLFGNSMFYDELLEDCFRKTQGNLEEIELYIKSNSKNIENGILKKDVTMDIKGTLNKLPPIQREIVLLAALFPSGIKVEYVTSLIRRLFYLEDETLEKELKKIITLGYVMLNSARNDLLKPTHDKINLSLETLNSNEDFFEFYNIVENGLEEIIERKKEDSDYLYLLHCYIGICDTKRLLNRIEFLENLIELKHNESSFLYLVELSNEYLNIDYNVILNLESRSLQLLLDACQKTCSFDVSQEILSLLCKFNKMNDKFALYSIKVKTQLYQFDKALDEIKKLPENNETILYKLIILEHLNYRDEIIEILKKFSKNDNIIQDKWYHIILRNTAHFYNYNTAYSRLNEALIYFKKCDSIFEMATVYNNLSVIQIWNGSESFKEANRNIKKAIALFKQIGSNEIFEPYYNKGVLCYLKGKIEKALEYFQASLEFVPKVLEMDVHLLKISIMICECSLCRTSINLLEKFLHESLNVEEILHDPWVRFQIEYNLKNIEEFRYGYSKLAPQKEYINEKKNTSLTIFTNLNFRHKKIPICLSLSPNWRY